MIPIFAFLILGAFIFAIGLVGILLNAKNLIRVLICIELILLSVNTNFIIFSHFINDIRGQLFVFFILAVAAAETAIGLSILTLIFRKKQNIDLNLLRTLKG